MPPHARPHWHDAYDAQTALWRWYRTRLGEEFLLSSYRDSARNLNPEAQSMLMDLHRGERTRMLDLDPIYVSGEMCEVVAAASESFDPEPLLETDLMTPRGFLLYEQAFSVPDRFDNPTWIKAIAWQRIFNTSGAMEREEHNELIEKIISEWPEYQPGAIGVVEDQIEALPGVVPYGITLTIYTDAHKEKFDHPSHFPPVVPLHMTPWYFGMSFDGNEVDENGLQTGAEWWWKIVQTTFRLMQQRIAHKTLSRPDRASRREGAKLKVPDEREVVVVRLRREAGERQEPSGEDANYSHRFIVSGHWRNQPYPSEGIHRQIWISPYVKGPEDKPLVVRPRRVYQWER
jgi:hypothetical protein